MGTAFREQVKDILAACTVFIEDTLSKEKLSGKAEEERNKLKKLLDNLKEEYQALKSESDWAKESQAQPTSGSTPNLYDAAVRSTAISGSELLNLGPKISGNLKKKGDGLLSNSKKKWCAIKDDVFYIYDKTSDKRQKGQIELSSAVVRKFDGGKKYPYGFEVVSKSTGSHVFFTSNDTELGNWLEALGFAEEKAPEGKDLYDDTETYEEFDTPQIIPMAPQPKAQLPEPEEEEDIYEDDTPRAPVKPVQAKKAIPPQPTKPVPSPPVRPDSEIYEDTVNDQEIYDDVETADNKPVSPRWNTESKPETQPKKPLPTPPGPSSIDYENLYYAVWGRKGDQPDELSFSQEDILLIKNKIFDKYSWWAAEMNGKVGYVPKAFLTPVYVPVK